MGVLEVSVQDSTSLAEASWRPWGPQILFLTTMAVKRVKRKQGIATALLRAAEDWSLAAHSDVSHAALLVYRNNDAATRYFSDLQGCGKAALCAHLSILRSGKHRPTGCLLVLVTL